MAVWRKRREVYPTSRSKKENSSIKICSHFGNAPVSCGAQAMSDRQERKYRRFHLECPVSVKFRAAGSVTEVETISKNMSIGGILVKSASRIPEHTPVAFIISVKVEHAANAIYLAGEGKIVRVESSQDDATFAIAVECSAPIIQLQKYLPPP